MVKFTKIPVKKIDVLILGYEGEQWLKYCIPNDLITEKIDVTRREIPWVKQYNFFFRLTYQVFIKKNKGLSLRRNVLYSVLFSIIDILEPSIIMTFIDNAYQKMSYLNKKYPEKLVISVQNGTRLSSEASLDSISTNTHLDTYFGFGDYEYQLMTNRGAVIDNYYPVGSLKNGLFLSRNKTIDKEYDICFVSHYSSQGYTSDDPIIQRMIDVSKELMVNVNEICKKHNMKFVIATKKQNIKSSNRVNTICDEVSGLRKIGIDDSQIIENIYNEYTSYNTCYKSELVIGLASTLDTEVFGGGVKVLFCGSADDSIKKYLMKDNLIMMPKEILLKSLNIKDIESKIFGLIEMKTDEYRRLTKKAREYYMRNDPIFPPHHCIERSIVNFKELNDIKRRG